MFFFGLKLLSYGTKDLKHEVVYWILLLVFEVGFFAGGVV